MNDITNNDMIDLGSDPAGEEFSPFLEDEESGGDTQAEASPQEAAAPETAVPANASTDSDTKAAAPKQDNTDKPPVFEYAGATENIDDTSKTFDELRIEKSADFPELEDGKRVSWTVEYGKITKSVPDPKGTSIGKMKSDIETSKEFEDSLKKRGADKNPTCKIKPRVTAQSKGHVSAYKGVYTNLAEAAASGKLITVFPARDGNVYEMRQNEIGRFITQSIGNDMLSEVKAGFTPALPPVPFKHLLKIINLFRKAEAENGNEALVNIIYDKHDKKYIVDMPEQAASPISVESRCNPEYGGERYIHFADIHSHCRMRAFFSETDNRDEKATRVYAVIGKVHNYFPEIKARISNGGTFLEIEPGIVFEEYNKKMNPAAMWLNHFQYRVKVLAGMLFGGFGIFGCHASACK